VKYLRSN